MKHVTKTIAGDKVAFHCQKCGEREVVKIHSRDQIGYETERFEKQHANCGKGK